jgi:hypothetical protein
VRIDNNQTEVLWASSDCPDGMVWEMHEIDGRKVTIICESHGVDIQDDGDSSTGDRIVGGSTNGFTISPSDSQPDQPRP